MAIALKVNGVGQLAQFLSGDSIDVNALDARDPNADITIGDNLNPTYEIVLGVAVGTGDTRIKGDLFVEGDATVSVDTVLSGAVQLGDGGGDTIDIGDPANPDSDTINVNSDLLMKGQAIINQNYTELSPAQISGTTDDYDPTNFGTADIVRQDQVTSAATITGFAAPGAGDNERFVIVNLHATFDLTLEDEGATSTAANRILGPDGNDVVLATNECAMLTYDSTSSRWRVIAVSQFATGASDTLQTAYAAGNTISVTSGNGAIQFSNTTDTTNVLELSGNNSGTLLSIAPSGSGIGLFLNNTGSGSAVQIQDGGNTVFEVTAAGEVDIDPSTGQDLVVTLDGSGATMWIANTGAADATLLDIDNTGSGNAIDIQDGGTSVFVIDGNGAVSVTPTSGQNLVLTAAGAGIVDINSADAIDIDAAGAITIDSSGGGISIQGAAASDLTTTSGGITIDAAGELTLESNQTATTTLTLSQGTAGERVLDQTGSGEIFNGVTSIVSALNELAQAIDVDGGPFVMEAVAGTGGVNAGDCVAQDTTSGQVVQWNGNGNANSKFVGIALNTVAATGTARVALPGSKVTDSGLGATPGDPLFGPDGTGRPTATAPAGTGDALKRVGWALTATTYVLETGPTVIL